MNRLKKFLFLGGSAAMLLAGIALISAPPSAEAAVTGPPPADCTFCAAQIESCHTPFVSSGFRYCYYRMSGPGTCPPCTPCRYLDIDPFR